MIFCRDFAQIRRNFVLEDESAAGLCDNRVHTYIYRVSSMKHHRDKAQISI